MGKGSGIDLPLLLLLTFLPLQWKGSLSVDLFGVFQLGFGQIPAWILLLIGLCRPLSFWRFFRSAPLFNTIFIAYYLYLGFSLVWSDNFEGALIAYRATVRSLIFYFAVGAYLVETAPARLSRTVFLAAPLSLTLFIVYALYTVLNTPVSELNPRILTGDPRLVLLTMLNYTEGESSLGVEDEEYQTTTIKNNIAAAFNTLLVLYMLLGLVGRLRILNPLTLLSVLLYPMVIMALLSRSNFAALLASFALVVVMHQISPVSTARTKLLSVTLALAGFLIISGVLSMKGGYAEDFAEAQADRYSETEGDVRFPHYRKVFRSLMDRPFTGYGFATKASDGLAVHNLFLGAWFQVGIIGLLLALGYYGALGFCFARSALDLILGRVNLHGEPVNIFWIPALLVIPMARALIIGAYGQWQTPDVVAIAFFTYLYGRLYRPATPSDS